MKVKIGEIVDAQLVADALGVCRRTVSSKARSANALVRIVGKDYVKRSKLRGFVSSGQWAAIASLERPLDDAGEIDTTSVVSRQAVASTCGCDPATVWRITKRMNLGVNVYGRRLLTKSMACDIKKCVGVGTETPEEVSERMRRAVNVRWNRWRAEKSGRSGKAAASSRSRRSPAVSR